MTKNDVYLYQLKRIRILIWTSYRVYKRDAKIKIINKQRNKSVKQKRTEQMLAESLYYQVKQHEQDKQDRE